MPLRCMSFTVVLLWRRQRHLYAGNYGADFAVPEIKPFAALHFFEAIVLYGDTAILFLKRKLERLAFVTFYSFRKIAAAEF